AARDAVPRRVSLPRRPRPRQARRVKHQLRSHMGDPIAWRGVSYGSSVFADDGTKVGTVHEILGSDSEDICHGVRLRLSNKRDVMVSSDDVTNLSTDGVSTQLTRTAIEALPTFAE